MRVVEKLFKIISKKNSFLNLAGILEHLQTLLEGHNIVPSDEGSDKINEADLVMAAQEVLLEKVHVLLRHQKQTELILKLQNELEAIILFAGKYASEKSKTLWNQALAVTPADLSGLGRGSDEAERLKTSHKQKVLNFIDQAQSQNIVPEKMKNILARESQEIQKIKSSCNKYRNSGKDNLTGEGKLLTLPNNSVTKSVAQNKAFYKG